MIIKNKLIELEVKQHLTHKVLVTSYYDGKKIGEKIYNLRSGDEINVKMTEPILNLEMP